MKHHNVQIGASTSEEVYQGNEGGTPLEEEIQGKGDMMGLRYGHQHQTQF